VFSSSNLGVDLMTIHVSRVQTRIVNHPLRPDRVVVSAAGRHDQSAFLQLALTDQDGTIGYAEAATTPLWSGETAEVAQNIIERLLGIRLLGATLDHPSEAQALVDSLTVCNSFAKSAIDTAVWDLWAKKQGRRVTDLIADRMPAVSIPTRASVGCYDVPTTLFIAKAFWDAGVRTLKFKIGVPGFSDVERLQAVREALGDAPLFTVDANGAYATEDQAVRAIEELLPFKLALVEQPTHRDRIAQLAKVRRRVAPMPILADECVFTPTDLDEALELDAFDLLSIYPGKNGGFTNSLAMVKKAHAAGKRCTIGCNLETDLGQAPMTALAAGLEAFPIEQFACDLPAILFYESSSVKEPLVFRNGRIELPTGAGFGVEPLP
jgi:L-alanine-DL-glutamate epimerase-like enolase superfamily enzyme